MVAQTWTNQATSAPDAMLRPFVRQRNILLTTYRRDGTPKSTPVHVAVADGRAYFRTWETAWKMRRIRRNPNVTIAPSTARGVPTRPAISARARALSGEEEAAAARALARKYPILHGVLIPRFHRLRGYRTVHCELTPTL